MSPVALTPPTRCRRDDPIIDVADGTSSAALTSLTKNTGLIVIGAHRRGDGHLGMRPGPIVHTLVHHADCPVVVVPR
jgi:nucleotide-binding universal stress UspA family protein